MTSPPQPNPPQPAPPAPAQPTEQQRLAAIETEQQQQRGLLQSILDKLPGKPAADPAPAPGGGQPAPGDVQTLIQRELDAAEQRRQAEAATAADGAWRARVTAAAERVEQLKPERAPGEPQTGLRGRLQRFTVGRAD